MDINQKRLSKYSKELNDIYIEQNKLTKKAEEIINKINKKIEMSFQTNPKYYNYWGPNSELKLSGNKQRQRYFGTTKKK